MEKGIRPEPVPKILDPELAPNLRKASAEIVLCWQKKPN